jgi:hypothetical protein
LFVEDDRTYTVVNAATKRYPRYLTVDPNAERIVAIITDLDEDDSGENDDDDEPDEPDEPDVKS